MVGFTAHKIRFDGKMLNRGFWLYVIDVRSTNRRYLYLGRTGDSSSPNAASPFMRIGRHLEFKPNAKGNTLVRNLWSVGVDPSNATFCMIAVGPLFPEQENMTEHKPIRDRMAALERDVAQVLRADGFEVLGSHSSHSSTEPRLLEEVLALLKDELEIKDGV